MVYEGQKHDDIPRVYDRDVDEKIRQSIDRALQALEDWKKGNNMAIHEARTAIASANNKVWWFARGKGGGGGR